MGDIRISEEQHGPAGRPPLRLRADVHPARPHRPLARVRSEGDGVVTEQVGRPLIGLLYRQTDAAMPLLDLAPCRRGSRLRLHRRRRAHPHPGVARITVPGHPRRRAARCVPGVPRPNVALAFIAAETTLRIAVGIALVAQHDPIALAKTVAHARPPLRGPAHPRRGVRLEPRGARQPREALRGPPGDRARARRADAGALDPGRGRVPRPARHPRAQLVVAQAGAGVDPDPPRRPGWRAGHGRHRRVG